MPPPKDGDGMTAFGPRNVRKDRRVCKMRNGDGVPVLVLAVRALDDTGQLSQPRPQAQTQWAKAQAALMESEWGLAGEGLKIGRRFMDPAAGEERLRGETGEKQQRTKARHPTPGRPGQGIFQEWANWAPHMD